MRYEQTSEKEVRSYIMREKHTFYFNRLPFKFFKSHKNNIISEKLKNKQTSV